MGKITDAAVAVIVIIIGLYILTRMGLTFPSIESMFHKFFFPSSGGSSNNTTAGLILFGMAASNSKIREKLKNHLVEMKRRILTSSLKKAEREARARDNYER
jgi:hypothetical protein